MPEKARRAEEAKFFPLIVRSKKCPWQNETFGNCEIKKESHSAKEAGQRPVFNEIVEEIKQGKFNGILTWAPDRISRNAGDLGRIVDLMDQRNTPRNSVPWTEIYQ